MVKVDPISIGLVKYEKSVFIDFLMVFETITITMQQRLQPLGF